MAWLAWAVVGIAAGVLFKLVARMHGAGGWFASISAGVAGAETGAWVAARIWGAGVLDITAGNLSGAGVGAIILLAVYFYRLHHRLAGTEYENPNAM